MNKVYEYDKNINLNFLNKKFKNTNISSFLIEKLNTMLVLFILTENGDIISLDMSKIYNKCQTRNRYLHTIFSEFVLIPILFILLLNSFILILFHKYRYTSRLSESHREELNNVIQDIIRLNEATNN